jgi:tRNA(adenine34) deaminase
MEHEYYMNLALQEALKALDEGEVPIGAVIIHESSVIGRGYNRIEALNDATAHAEIIAISAATASLDTWRLNGSTLYVTLEPCLMCLGAILQSRIETVVFGAGDSRFGAIETYSYREKAEQAYRRFPQTVGNILENECRSLIQSFFKKIRKKS